LAHHTSGSISARRVVLALPPRVATEAIRCEPALPKTALDAMAAVPTWMAGQAKILAVYDRPYWREAGFSGDAASHRGPMVELHDASPAIGGPYAIFGFVGLPAQTRALRVPEVIMAARRQLHSLFGPAMAEPLSIEMMDWARESQISTPMDQASPSYHARYGLPQALRGLWNGRLLFSSTEMAPEFGGFLEGALEAAEKTAEAIGANSVQPDHL
jgi:monoamine oxidase